MANHVQLAGITYRVEPLARPRFDLNPDLWQCEGSGQVEFHGTSVFIDTLPHLVETVWFKHDLAGDVYIVFDALVIPPRGESNINLFLHAQMINGYDVLSKAHSGDYAEYHQTCAMYIVTLTGYDPDGRRDAEGNLVTVGWSRLRKDPGFRLLSENLAAKSEVSVPYRVEVVQHQGHLLHAVNGATVHDVVDPEPLLHGKFAFRTFNTRLVCQNLEIARIISVE